MSRMGFALGFLFCMLFGNLSAVAGGALVIQDGSFSEATITQNGLGDTASLYQHLGVSNIGAIMQMGSANQATLKQSGDGNQASQLQIRSGNTGENRAGKWLQSGHTNSDWGQPFQLDPPNWGHDRDGDANEVSQGAPVIDAWLRSLMILTALALVAWLVVPPGFAGQASDIDQLGRSDLSSVSPQLPSTPLDPKSKDGRNVPSAPGAKALGQIGAAQEPKQQARVPQTKAERDLCEEVLTHRRSNIPGLDCSRSQLDSLRKREPTPEEVLSNEQPGGDALAGQHIPVPDKSISPIFIISP